MSRKKPEKPPRPPFRRTGLKPGPSTLEKYPDHARVLGLIIAEWNSIEYMLVTVFGQAIKVNPFIMYPIMGSIYSSHQKFTAMRLVLPLAKLPDDVQGEIDDVLAEAEKVVKLRNQYAHAHYAESSAHPVVLLRMQDINDANGLDAPASLEEMQQLFGRMRDMGGRLMQLVSAITFPEFHAQILPEQDQRQK